MQFGKFLRHYQSYTVDELTKMLNRYLCGDLCLSEDEFDALYAAWEGYYLCNSNS